MYSYGNKVGLDTHILHQDTRLACFNSFFCWFFDKAVVSALGPSIILEINFLSSVQPPITKKNKHRKGRRGQKQKGQGLPGENVAQNYDEKKSLLRWTDTALREKYEGRSEKG